MPRKILCLDWDKRSLRMVVARAGRGGMELEDAHAHRIPNTVDADDAQAMGAFIAQMQRRHHWHHRRVIVDVPRDKAVLNRMTVVPTPLHELAASVRFQALKELPFPLDEAVIDYVIMERDEDGRATEVLLAAVRNETLDRLRETCQAAGLTPARIGLRPYANQVSVRHLPGLVEQSVLLLDVGPTTTEIDIVVRGALAFSRAANVTLPVGGTELITDSTSGSAIAAMAEVESPTLSSASEKTAVGELLVEVTRTLQAYRATQPDAVVDRVVIGGSSGLETRLVSAVEERFGMRTELFDPTSVLEVDASEAAKLRSFSAALGLAWGVGQEGLLELDFVNPKKPVPQGHALKQRLRLAGIAAALVIVGAGVALGKQIWDKKAELAELRDAIDGNSELAREAKRELDVLDNVDIVGEWEQKDEMLAWLDHLLVLTQNMIEPGKKMLVRAVTMDERKATIVVELWCADHETLTDFVNRIKAYNDGGPYDADIEKSFTRDPKREAGLQGEATVKVELRRLQKYASKEKTRERERKSRRRQVLSGQEYEGGRE